jgi:hypothetical protein
VRTITSIIVWFATSSPIWALGQEPDAEFRPVGLWRFLADQYTATVDFSARGTCLITYQSAGFTEYRGCGWEASGRTVNVYPFESESWEPVALIAANDVSLEFALDRRVVFRRLTWKHH